MMNSRVMRGILAVIGSILFFGFLPALQPAQAGTATLEFHETTIGTNQGETYDAFILIDTGGEPVLGSDIYVTYNPSDIMVTAIDSSGFFPEFIVEHNATTGKIGIHAYVNTSKQLVTGDGAVGVISFQPKRQTGAGSLTMMCTSSGTATIVLNAQQQNILPCNQIRNVTLDFTGAASQLQQEEDPTPTPTRRPTARPTARPVSEESIPSFEESFSENYPFSEPTYQTEEVPLPTDFPFAAFSENEQTAETPSSVNPLPKLPTAESATALVGSLRWAVPIMVGTLVFVVIVWAILKIQQQRKADQFFSNLNRTPQPPTAQPPVVPPPTNQPQAHVPPANSTAPPTPPA